MLLFSTFVLAHSGLGFVPIAAWYDKPPHYLDKKLRENKVMQLEKEDKKKILDAASDMMGAFSEMRVAVERMKIFHTIAGNLAGIQFPADVVKSGLNPFEEAFRKARERFCTLIGVGSDDKEFWEWYDSQPPSMEQLKHKKKEVMG